MTPSIEVAGRSIPVSQDSWDRTPPEVQALVLALLVANEALTKQVETLSKQVETLTKRVLELEEQVKSNSTNSSKPPSSDPPGTLRNRRKPSGQRPGGKKGHKGHHRELAPTEKVDHVVEHYPEKCSGCGLPLTEHHVHFEPPVRHQVWELPPVRAEVTEHQRHRATCPVCATTTLASLPPDVPKGQFGPRLTAMAGLLVGQYRLSKRQCESLLLSGFGVSISLGSISHLEGLISESLKEVHEEAHSAVKTAPVAGADDTGWKEGKGKAVLWNANTQELAIFMITQRKDHESARKLLGDCFEGILGVDRATTYSFQPVERLQTCWAHLDRHFQRMEDRGGESAEIGSWGKAEVDRFFHEWHKFKDGTISRLQLQAEIVPIRARMARLLRRGTDSGHSKTANTCCNILDKFRALWTCIYREGVEPTNNSSERALRHPVQWRRTSFGTKSAAGSRFVERILTVVESCRRQGRNALDFLGKAVAAMTDGSTRRPSLLPHPGG